MKKIVITLSFILSVVSVYADDFASVALAQKARKKDVIAPYQSVAKEQQWRVQQRMRSPEFQAFKALALQQKNPLEEYANSHQPVSNAIIFVSFSMPKKSLEQWLVAAREIHAPVVLRGMVDNSIQKTKEKILPIVQKVHGGFQINPVLFRNFDIQQVPAVVVVNHHGCQTDADCGLAKQFDVIYGQSTLRYALSQLSQKGEQAPAVAEKLLTWLPGEITHA